jgi:hypothetical protein
MTRAHRGGVGLGVGLLAGAFVLYWGWRTTGLEGWASDFDQVWFAARALREGWNPYDVIGPGRRFDGTWPLFYPLTTAIAMLPFSFLPVVAARVIFVVTSATVFTYAITDRGTARLPVLLSLSFMYAVAAAQWTPLLAAAFVLPWWAWVLPLKPNVGGAVAVAAPQRTVLPVAATAGALLLAVSFAVQPSWVSDWRDALREAPHLHVPFLSLGGPFLALAVLRWRRADAWLLLGYACLPHNPLVYEVLPLALVTQTRREAILFALATNAALVAQNYLLEMVPLADRARWAAVILNVLVYYPCLAMILRRPNEGPSPAILSLLRVTGKGRPRPAASVP